METESIFALTGTVNVAFPREGRYWVAQALNVDISSLGETLEDARAAIKDALELYFEDAPPQMLKALS